MDWSNGFASPAFPFGSNRNFWERCHSWQSWKPRICSSFKDGIAGLGSKIIHNKQCIGEVTSSSWSPYQECGVAIVRLNNNFTDINSPVEVYDYKNEKLNAYICDLPMYDKNAEIVRGIDRKVPKTSNPWFK